MPIYTARGSDRMSAGSTVAQLPLATHHHAPGIAKRLIAELVDIGVPILVVILSE